MTVDHRYLFKRQTSMKLYGNNKYAYIAITDVNIWFQINNNYSTTASRIQTQSTTLFSLRPKIIHVFRCT